MAWERKIALFRWSGYDEVTGGSFTFMRDISNEVVSCGAGFDRDGGDLGPTIKLARQFSGINDVLSANVIVVFGTETEMLNMAGAEENATPLSIGWINTPEESFSGTSVRTTGLAQAFLENVMPDTTVEGTNDLTVILRTLFSEYDTDIKPLDWDQSAEVLTGIELTDYVCDGSKSLLNIMQDFAVMAGRWHWGFCGDVTQSLTGQICYIHFLPPDNESVTAITNTQYGDGFRLAYKISGGVCNWVNVQYTYTDATTLLEQNGKNFYPDADEATHATARVQQASSAARYGSRGKTVSLRRLGSIAASSTAATNIAWSVGANHFEPTPLKGFVVPMFDLTDASWNIYKPKGRYCNIQDPVGDVHKDQTIQSATYSFDEGVNVEVHAGTERPDVAATEPVANVIRATSEVEQVTGTAARAIVDLIKTTATDYATSASGAGAGIWLEWTGE